MQVFSEAANCNIFLQGMQISFLRIKIQLYVSVKAYDIVCANSYA